MAKAEIILGEGSGGSGEKVASGYYASDPPSTFNTVDDITGESFEPKKIMVCYKYGTSSTATMACMYFKDVSSSSYIRYYGGTYSTQSLGTSNSGLANVSSTGFTMNLGTTGNTDFYYIAIG